MDRQSSPGMPSRWCRDGCRRRVCRRQGPATRLHGSGCSGQGHQVSREPRAKARFSKTRSRSIKFVFLMARCRQVILPAREISFVRRGRSRFGKIVGGQDHGGRAEHPHPQRASTNYHSQVTRGTKPPYPPFQPHSHPYPTIAVKAQRELRFLTVKVNDLRDAGNGTKTRVTHSIPS